MQLIAAWPRPLLRPGLARTWVRLIPALLVEDMPVMRQITANAHFNLTMQNDRQSV